MRFVRPSRVAHGSAALLAVPCSLRSSLPLPRLWVHGPLRRGLLMNAADRAAHWLGLVVGWCVVSFLGGVILGEFIADRYVS